MQDTHSEERYQVLKKWQNKIHLIKEERELEWFKKQLKIEENNRVDRKSRKRINVENTSSIKKDSLLLDIIRELLNIQSESITFHI